ncbi:MAG TPA: carbohydrate ABC transporter permease, partial [Clostridiales bacterium]|nr:carbohydrate ABC transporter permease [Clostridiales bacterium]
GMVYMGIALSIVPLVVVYFLLSKYIVEGVALGGVKE